MCGCVIPGSSIIVFSFVCVQSICGSEFNSIERRKQRRIFFRSFPHIYEEEDEVEEVEEEKKINRII